MGRVITFVGLFLALGGACLLFFYGLPRKRVGNVIICGCTAMKYSAGPGERDIPDSEWQPIADRFQKKAKTLNSAGFALLAAGTVLQMVALYAPAR